MRKNPVRRKPKTKRTNKVQKMKVNHLFILKAVLAIAILALGCFAYMKFTENGTWLVYQSASAKSPVATYHHFSFAKRNMEKQQDPTAYVANEEGKVYAMKAGSVIFNTKDVSEVTNYISDATGQAGYLNGSYGFDGVYLDTDSKGQKIKAEMAGETLWVDADDVVLETYNPNIQLSYYYRSQTNLYHRIVIDGYNGEAYDFLVVPAPDFLEENVGYYSYDGNYFYDDFQKLSQDAVKNNHKNAVNETVWYNPAQFLTHNSKSTITNEEANAFLADFGFDDSNSVLYDAYDTFKKVEDETGVNASMMFALAANESGFGSSNFAINNYNLFGHQAYDENPDAASSYASLEECIYQHANEYVKGIFSNPKDDRWHGSWFGDKASGIAYSYASDPYWGEKAAGYFYRLDPNSLASMNLDVFRTGSDLNVYASMNTDKVLYTFKKGEIVALNILDEKVERGRAWYKVALEYATDQKDDKTGLSVGYVLKNAIEKQE